MGKRTPLYDAHLALGARMTNFFGWDMPLNYGSQLDEHLVVRKSAGVFDISHMTIVDIHGPDTEAYLCHLLANNIDRLKESGQALYTCMLNSEGGIKDDLIVYRLDDHYYRMVVNSATHDKDLEWLQKQVSDYAVEIDERTRLAMLAVQGPEAIEKVKQIVSKELVQAISSLKRFSAVEIRDWFIARTGYTGEDGLEIVLPEEEATDFWNKLLKVGVQPCGLGARDTLRLEAGLNLYGVDMDETTSPFESNLTWTIAFEPEDRDFVGRRALMELKEKGIQKKLVGVVLCQRGVLRNQQKVMIEDVGNGVITSGGFSPTLQRGIGIARVPVETGDECQVKIRDKILTAKIISLPFIKAGKPTFDLI